MTSFIILLHAVTILLIAVNQFKHSVRITSLEQKIQLYKGEINSYKQVLMDEGIIVRTSVPDEDKLK